MHPVLSIGIYLFMQLVILLLASHCLRCGAFLPQGSIAGKTILAALLLVFIVLSLLPVAGALLPESRLKFRLQGAGDIWLGFDIYFGGLLLILTFLAQILGRTAFHKEKGILFTGALGVSLCAGVILLVYGMIHAQHTILTEQDIVIEKDTDDLKDLKVVLIGDLHLSVNSHLSTISRMVEMINEQDADAVLIAGDIFTSSYEALENPEKYAAVLKEMKTRYGVYAVYGNHDVEETLFGGFPISPISQAFRTREMEDFFRDCGFTVLYDETVTIADDRVQITGRVDGEKAGDGTALRKSPSEVLGDVDREKPVIVLQHEPVEFEQLKEAGADLALCGHTHAGQIFPGNLIVPFFNENAYGFRNVAGLDTVVTSGIGYYGPPMRIGTNSEIMVLNIHFAQEL